MKKFRWIHLSDIHFQTKNVSFNTQKLREKLPEFLAGLDGNFDAMIITGDFRYAPEKENNPQKVVDYINLLCEKLRWTDTPKVITVPGNHDLDRGSVRTAVIRSAKDKYQPNMGTFDPELLGQLLGGFNFYNNMHEKLRDVSQWDGSNPHGIAEFDECNFLLLNTAVTAGLSSEEEQHTLLLGSSYVAEKLDYLKKKNKPVIAIGHHALELLSTEEKREITNLFEQEGVRLYLCGHSHSQEADSFSQNGRYVNIGCLLQKSKTEAVRASFDIGELETDGTVKLTSYKWDIDQKNWFADPPYDRDYRSLYDFPKINDNSKEKKHIKLVENPFTIVGYTLLGSLGCDGIKYYWKKDDKYVESIAFNRRLRNLKIKEDADISAYTISTSFGCVLSATEQQCRFCETGTLKFGGHLRAEDIALQCIFMAEYDSNCPSYKQVRNNAREFAFMGQGEPGYCYPAIKRAIMYTDYVMDKLGQKVSRYVISTCGVTEFIQALTEDLKNSVFKNKITIHLSLHEIDEKRNELMPINNIYDYQEVIACCKKLYQVTNEKIGVGILMFDKYQTKDGKSYTLTPKRLEEILSVLDNDVFRIDLCFVNNTDAGRQKHELSNEMADALFQVVLDKGFEGKIFTSFGDMQKSGCGMLYSSMENKSEVGSTTIEHFNKAVQLLQEVKEYCYER